MEPTSVVKKATPSSVSKSSRLHSSTNDRTKPDPSIDLALLRKPLSRVATHPTLTPFRRRVYRTLLSVPHGRWTTYSALSNHLNSGPRAIGNAMKTNPFAPAVPCHRVLATDRTLGGYKGAWNNGGEYSVEKRKLLDGEGVEFDEKNRARGDCFVDFVDMGSI
ncbi:6-O-methylguanine DNA methyltransferase [Talaromyces proteolyticus]|uniref:Methylated-DNA--protein-cysteine methyltransferase n=1 Tax=Talaromyces proteolyticus TaxID=1131652 RepID=A0AAD4KYE9_9EURO|nr:6-O-methylguanine DNA methyltransferase [Talaromyces proteolyticus]KAH8703237.1 6-O-methylguanine DNA methyltransferase [Talaromyces proteolyticus]